MGERKSREFIEGLKKKHGVSEIWSWSKYNTAKNDKYTYLLKYILTIPEQDKSSIYGVSGGVCHDIIEKFYRKEIKFEDMIKEYEDALFEMESAELKYNRNDDDKNLKIANKYEENIKLFFENHQPILEKVILEQFVTAKVGDYLFQGYIDCVTKNDAGKYVILDWKTSTIYTGKKIIKESGQLTLYALALMQLGIKVEDIKIGWNFLKYCTVTITTTTVDKETKLNKVRTKNCLRNEWVSEIKTHLAKWLKKLDIDEEISENLIEKAVKENSLDCMPKQIQDKFYTGDCYVFLELTNENIEEFKKEVIETIKDINERTGEYLITNDDTLFWTKVDASNLYFYANLSGYGLLHRPYKEYLEESAMFNSVENKNNDDDWLKDL